mgnify:CR=1 FL=1
MSRIEQALLIVVVAGHTAGLQWELEQLLRSGSLSKTIVVRGPIKDTKPAGALLLQDTLRLLPDIAKLVQAEQLVGVVGVYINKIGELVLLRSERERAADYQRAMAYAVHGILCT